MLSMAEFPTPHQVHAGEVSCLLPRRAIAGKDAILDDLKGHLIKAQQQMRHYEDGKRRTVHFEVGNSVYLKLQPYRQKSLAKRANGKLSPRFYGPFEILEKIGQ